MGVGVEAVGAPDAPRGQTVSGGESGADHGIAYDGTEFGAAVATAAGDVRAGTVDGWLGWRTGAGIGVVGEEVGKRRG